MYIQSHNPIPTKYINMMQYRNRTICEHNIYIYYPDNRMLPVLIIRLMHYVTSCEIKI